MRSIDVEVMSVQPEPCEEAQLILDFLDSTLHPLVSPEHWNVNSELHDKIISLLYAKPRLLWIPVNEKLPEDGTWCLFTDGRNISVERYKKDAFDHFLPEGRWFDFDEAVAWMPLPEPYRGGENGE